MRKCLFILLVFFLNGGTVLYAQSFWEWTDPKALTDSLSNNHNPFLLRIYNNLEEQVYMVWERSSDSLTTGLYIDNILDTIPPEMVMHENGIQYTNPLLLKMPYTTSPDSLFFLFYESNENGHTDIRYCIMLADGTFTQSGAFAATDQDDAQLDVTGGAFYNTDQPYAISKLTWIQDEKLMYAGLEADGNSWYFTEAETIDSTACTNPLVSVMDQTIFYLKADSSGSKHVYRAHKTSQSGWVKTMVYDDGNCQNLTKDRVLSDYLCWAAERDGEWKLIFYYWGMTEELDLTADEALDPAVMGNDIITKSTASQYQYAHIAVPYSEGGFDEIFMNPEPYYNLAFENFTQSMCNNRCPAFFPGENVGSCFYVYLLWETEKGSHWQINSSKIILCIGGIPEYTAEDPGLMVHPNPFTGSSTISFTLKESSSCRIDIRNARGTLVKTMGEQLFDRGLNNHQWNGADLPSGIYFISLTCHGRTFSYKCVKL